MGVGIIIFVRTMADGKEMRAPDDELAMYPITRRNPFTGLEQTVGPTIAQRYERAFESIARKEQARWVAHAPTPFVRVIADIDSGALSKLEARWAVRIADEDCLFGEPPVEFANAFLSGLVRLCKAAVASNRELFACTHM